LSVKREFFAYFSRIVKRNSLKDLSVILSLWFKYRPILLTPHIKLLKIVIVFLSFAAIVAKLLRR